MKVLIVGGGGREHALAWKLTRETARPRARRRARQPGHRRARPLRRRSPPPTSTRSSRSPRPSGRDSRSSGPRRRSRLGLVDRFRARGLAVFGPTRAAARDRDVEGLREAAHARRRHAHRARDTHTDVADGARAPPRRVRRAGRHQGVGARRRQGRHRLRRRSPRPTRRSTHARRRRVRRRRRRVLVEEFMEGEELSVFVPHRRQRASRSSPAQDHKRLLDGDDGPEHRRHGRLRAGLAGDSVGARHAHRRRRSMRGSSTADAARRCASAGRAVHRAALRGPDAHARRPEGRRVQLPLRRSRDAGRPSAARPRSRRSSRR